ncbi:Fic family protein [Candidatus Gottesmanbacteria bacterium]|nr:Fic family protein [Candidatus Gottesmanbacteria bacterium]
MLIPPKYTLTAKISQYLSSIESSKAVIDSISIPAEVEMNIRRSSTLKSSLYSARIEGNQLTEADLESPSKTQSKIEIFNILKALNFINKTAGRDITIKDIADIHKLVMDKLSPEAGVFRTEPSAIYNAAGIAIYLPPPPRYIQSNLTKFIDYIKNPKERFTPILAVLGHYIFEKIHPFIDCNGRVGRILLQKILIQGGYGMKGVINFEQNLDNNRSGYYRSLEEPEKEATNYVEFMLEILSEASLATKELLLSKKEPNPEDFLMPRRAEIYNIIKDHSLVNFDQIRRRFMAVNERTLRFDLKRLQDGGFIIKLGTTKGVYYKPAKSPYN